MNNPFNPEDYTRYSLEEGKQIQDCGVYGIYNNDNNKLYIGHTTVGIGQRIVINSYCTHIHPFVLAVWD